MILVDILLPTFNGEKYIKDQIESLLFQSHKEINIYIRDDCSTDNTFNILKEMSIRDKRIIMINQPSMNLGIVASVEALLNQSKSDFIMFCDQDDIWFPEKVKVMLNSILNHENSFGKDIPLLVHSDCFVTDKNLKIKGRFKKNRPLKYGLAKSLFMYNVQGSSSIINKSLKKEILPFNEFVYIHDRYFHLVSELVGKRFYIQEPLMYYRQHNDNVLGSKSFFKKLLLNINNLNQTYYQYKDKNLLLYFLRNGYSENQLLIVYQLLTAGKKNRIKKLKLMYTNKISMRIKEFLLLIIKG